VTLAAPERRLDVACLALLGLAIVVAFGDALAPGRALLFRDHSGGYRPLFYFLREELLAGRLPLLTRFSNAGVPMEQSLAAFSFTPLTLILLLGPFDSVYELFVAAHFMVLGAGVFVLARSLNASRATALATAGFGALAGPVLSQENLLTLLSGLTWAPWVWWAFAGLLRAPSGRRAAAFALAVAFHVQGLIPTFFLLDFVAAGFLVALLGPPRSPRRSAAYLVGAAALGLALSAVELFPLLEVLGRSARGRGFSAEELGYWSLQPLQLLDLFAPAIWAPPELPFAIVREAVGSDRAPYLSSLYLGPALALITVGGLAPGPRRRLRLALLIGVVIALLAATGERTPLHGLLVRLPLLRSERYPIKRVVIAAALGAPLLGPGIRSPRAAAALALGWLGVLVSALSTLGAPEVLEFLSANLGSDVPARFIGVDPSSYPAMLIGAMRVRLLLSAASGAALLLVLLFGKHRTAELAALVILGDLALAGQRTIVPADLLPGPSEVERVAAREPNGWLYLATPGGRLPEAQRRDGKSPFDDLLRSAQLRGSTAYRLLRLAPTLDRDAQANPLLMLGYRLLGDVTQREAKLRLLGRLGVSFIARTLPDPEVLDAVRVEIPGEEPEYVIPNPYRRPYAEAFADWRRIDPGALGGPAVRELLTDRANDRTLFLLGEGTPTSPRAGCTRSSSASVSSEAEGNVVLEVSGECPNMLLLREVEAPGWQVELDGAPAEKVVADFGFLAAAVPPGAHRVRFHFEPLSRRYIPVSLAAAVLAAVLFAFRSGSRRRSLAGAEQDRGGVG
jgi:hypothetical protein